MYLDTSKLLILGLVIVALLLIGCESEAHAPRAGRPPTKPLPPSMKGYELYSWQAGQEWYFTLVTATNRIKTHQEITSGQDVIENAWTKLTVQGVHDVEAALAKLPATTSVLWIGPQALRSRGVKPGDLALPPRRTQRDLRALCQELGIHLEVSY